MNIFSESYYARYLKHFETCGGCTILGGVGNCRYFAICSHVERLASKGVVKSSKDFIDRNDLSITKPAKNRYPATGTGPCEVD